MSDPYALIDRQIVKGDNSALHGKSIFEFGFGDFGQTLDLYYRAPFLKFDGYEKHPENELTVMVKDGNARSGGAVSHPCSIFNRYEGYCKLAEIQIPLTENEFDETFSLSFETSIEDFVQNPKEHRLYDIGVFSKVFHKLESRDLSQAMVDWLWHNSSPDAFLLVTVMTSDKYAIQGRDWIYNEDEIINLLDCFPGEIVDSESINGDFKSVLKRKTTHNKS